MKHGFLIFFCVATCLCARADHITGGEMFYTLTGFSGNQYSYHVTAKFFKDCAINRQLNTSNFFSVFEKGSNEPLQVLTVSLTRTETLNLNNNNPCITNPPQVCYEVGYYEFDLILPGSAKGFVIATQVNFRINTINNMTLGYGNIGATYTAEIPGNQAQQNNSARFTASDLVVICSNNAFNYSFAAEDKDGDALRYSFCQAYKSSGGGGGASTPPPNAPPYTSVPYGQGFTATTPLGFNVRIDTLTGMINGIAPADGTYVVTVCVQEIRNGVVIAEQRKDLQIKITSCSIASASILPEYQLCKESFVLNVANASTSPLIKTYTWDLLNNKNEIIYTTGSQNLTYTFQDTGMYKMKLVVNRHEQCSDSSLSDVHVYPGFKADFSFTGSCITHSTLFKDGSASRYGKVDQWSWNFGEGLGLAVDADGQNETHQYNTTGTKNVTLIASNTVGCRDTATKAIAIFDKPPINTAFKDTLICKNDVVQLQASGNGTFTWSETTGTQQAADSQISVSPNQTTTYTVSLNDQGCMNTDTVRVRVVNAVTLQVMQDTTICAGDAITLKGISDGLQYSWQPAQNLQSPNALNTMAVTTVTTTYTLTAKIGGCTATDNVVVTTVPYPMANAGRDTTLCFNGSGQLRGSITGSRFTWSNTETLNNATTLTPIAKPLTSTAYILSAFDVQGCPKPGRDTVIVSMLQQIVASAGKDTAIIIGQPLQLQASGGSAYQWSPAEDLTAATISNPVAQFNAPSDGNQLKVFVYNEVGCVDSAYITVKVFKTTPTVFVPTAFTPNGDGKNDVLKPIAAGMQRIDYFNIYNRWGQLVYSSQQNSNGWNGLIGGQQQGTGTYIWVVKAVDFTGKSYMQKGMVTLIR